MDRSGFGNLRVLVVLKREGWAAIGRGLPKAITVGTSTEFTSKALDEWAWLRGAKFDYTQPGKPTNNGLIESFNGRLRDFLNVNEFVTMEDVRDKLKAGARKLCYQIDRK